MPFSYYERLSARAKAIYDRSDAVVTVPLSQPALLRPFVEGLRTALAADDAPAVQAAASYLTRALAEMIGVPAVRVQVLAVRPRADWGELHGLYTREEGKTPVVQLWMRTARHARVVAFRTFLRTLLHELGHHLDYEHLKLADSLHTEGFFKRESHLFRQLVPEEPVRPARGRSTRRTGPASR
jgi:hypothetical protein